MPIHVRPADLTLLPQVVVTTARRERFLRRVATVVTMLAALVAVLVVSVISVTLGLMT